MKMSKSLPSRSSFCKRVYTTGYCQVFHQLRIFNHVCMILKNMHFKCGNSWHLEFISVEEQTMMSPLQKAILSQLGKMQKNSISGGRQDVQVCQISGECENEYVLITSTQIFKVHSSLTTKFLLTTLVTSLYTTGLCLLNIGDTAGLQPSSEKPLLTYIR